MGFLPQIKQEAFAFFNYYKISILKKKSNFTILIIENLLAYVAQYRYKAQEYDAHAA